MMASSGDDGASESISKRRPGREEIDRSSPAREPVGKKAASKPKEKVKVVDVEEGNGHAAEELHAEQLNGDHPAEDHSYNGHASSHSEPAAEADSEKVELNFPGSEILRAKFPHSFDVAEAVATDWIHDGQFNELPVENIVAKVAVQKGLRKAKELEKKVLTSPVTEKVATEALTYALKAQSLFNKLKSQLKK